MNKAAYLNNVPPSNYDKFKDRPHNNSADIAVIFPEIAHSDKFERYSISKTHTKILVIIKPNQ